MATGDPGPGHEPSTQEVPVKEYLKIAIVAIVAILLVKLVASKIPALGFLSAV